MLYRLHGVGRIGARRHETMVCASGIEHIASSRVVPGFRTRWFRAPKILMNAGQQTEDQNEGRGAFHARYSSVRPLFGLLGLKSSYDNSLNTIPS